MTRRRCTGYDEYEGVFGPLDTYGASSDRRHPARRRNGPSLDGGTLSERARYLDERRARRRLRALDVENDSGVDSEREGAEPLALKPAAHAPPPRQVWLPTRDFSFRQRAGKLDTRAIARLDLERIVATTDIDAIQRHLENVAFADVTADDMQHYSDAYFLKLFQIAQLTLEYLLNVQESLVSHSESVETQCEQLLAECRQLEAENGAFEAEVAGLKKDIRHKQRTMATFEVMLLNASVAQRRAVPPWAVDKENAAAEANAIVDSLLGGAGGAEEREAGVVSQPVDCVVCGKKFLSAEYLIRHQQRTHQTKKKQAKRASSSSSSSSGNASKKRRAKTAPLPTEVARALEEKNELATQLLQLQEQLRVEKAARDAQTKLLENQQSQLTSQVAGSMGKLQEMLVAIEKKQEAAKHDIMQYTQATLARLQAEAAAAVPSKAGGASGSRAGAIESDEDKHDDACAVRRSAADGDRSAGRQEAQLEKMLEVFFKAQAQQQQEIDALAQENSKLWSKKRKKQRRHPSVEPSTLMQMAALDAQRFGVDTGAVEQEALVPSVAARPVERLALQEDKLVQTDDEDAESKQPKKAAALKTQEVQTDDGPAAPATAALTPASVPTKMSDPPVRRNTVDERKFAAPKRVEATPVIVADPPTETLEKHLAVVELEEETSQPVEDKDAKLQHAAHVVGKVALGFLARRRLKNPANWLISLPLAALEAALSEEERSALHGGSGDTATELAVEVELGMTANELRLEIARALSGEKDPGDSLARIDYHRVLLHHSDTQEELHGDRSVHELRNKIEVELVPTYQAAEEHVDAVCAFHSEVTARLQDIRRASVQLEHERRDESLEGPRLRRLVRLQARVRGFLAKRRVATIKIDRLVELRVLRTASRRRSTASDERADATSSSNRSALLEDPEVAEQYRKVCERLKAAVRDKLKLGSRDSGDSANRMSAATLEQQLRLLEQERGRRPAEVQERIRSLQTRLERLVLAEYDPLVVDGAAAALPSAVHVAIARRRLRTLLARDREDRAATPDAESGERSRRSPAKPAPDDPSEAASSSKLPAAAAASRDDSERVDDFDDEEIEKLADAYEDGGARVSAEGERSGDSSASRLASDSVVITPATPAIAERPSTPPAAVAAAVVAPKPAAAAVARRSMPLPPKLTPTPHSERPPTPIHQQAEAAGRSPRPKLQDKGVISPFSKTPLLSRRSGPATRRGSGFDNAR